MIFLGDHIMLRKFMPREDRFFRFIQSQRGSHPRRSTGVQSSLNTWTVLKCTRQIKDIEHKADEVTHHRRFASQNLITHQRGYPRLITKWMTSLISSKLRHAFIFMTFKKDPDQYCRYRQGAEKSKVRSPA